MSLHVEMEKVIAHVCNGYPEEFYKVTGWDRDDRDINLSVAYLGDNGLVTIYDKNTGREFELFGVALDEDIIFKMVEGYLWQHYNVKPRY